MTGALRIQRVAHFAYPDVVGGIQVYCHELSTLQAKKGHRVQVLACRFDHSPRSDESPFQYRTVRFGVVWTPWDAIGLRNPVPPSLYSYLTRSDQDLIDVHSHLFWSSAIAIKAAKKRRIPVLTTMHGLMAHRTKLVNILQKSFIESVGIWVLRNSSRVICLTQAEAAEVNQLGIPRRRITVIPSGVDTKKFAPSATEGNYVLWLGRFVPEKGIECLIEAASILAKRGLDVDFLLVGSGPLKRRLQESAKMTGGARIRFADSIPYSLVPNVMKACMVFVLPSIREGFPRTLLEAMSSGKPVIATNTPTLREIVGGCGILVQPRDAKSLADAIAKLATEPHYRKALGESARARVLDEYDWRHVLEKLDSVYEEVVANPGT